MIFLLESVFVGGIMCMNYLGGCLWCYAIGLELHVWLKLCIMYISTGMFGLSIWICRFHSPLTMNGFVYICIDPDDWVLLKGRRNQATGICGCYHSLFLI